MSNATNAQTTPVSVTAKEWVLTTKHEWHQQAASSIFEAGLRGVPGANMYYKIPETENAVQAAENVRDIFFYMLNIPAGTPYPANGLQDSQVVRAWYEIYAKAPETLLPSINDLGNDCSLMQFVFCGTTAGFDHTLVRESFGVKNAKNAELIKRWWDDIREIAKAHFSTSNVATVHEDTDNLYQLSLSGLVSIFCAFGDIIDLGYWNCESDIISNLVSCNISVNRVLEYIREELGLTRQELRGRLSADWYTSATTLTKLYRLTSVERAKEGSSQSTKLGRGYNYSSEETATANQFGKQMPAVFNDFCRYVWESLSVDGLSEKALTQRNAMLDHIFNENRWSGPSAVGVVLDLPHWNYIIKHAGWFNATHKYTEDGVTTQHHGHDFLRAATKAPIEDLSTMVPMELANASIKEKHKQTVDNLSGYKFPQLPADLVTLLPKGVEVVNTPPQLYTEGAVMHHCCGGNSYMSRVSRGTSWFFHIMTPESNMGVTTELSVEDDVFSDNQSRGLQNCNPTQAEYALINHLITTMNEYGSRPENKGWVKNAIAAVAEMNAGRNDDSDDDWD